MSCLVEASDVHRSYDSGAGAVPVLRGVSLWIDAGESVVLSGRSGSGKTTLLNIIGGIDRADSGRLTVCDTDLLEADQDRLAELRRTSVSFVFQAFGLLPVLSAAENVEVPLRLREVPAAERKERVGEMLRAVGLDGRARHRPGELSGGEQQRVAIARALVGRPRLLIADEPTGQLDTTTGRQIMELLSHLAQKNGLAMLVATHDRSAARIASRHLLLSGGVIADDT
jgi:putative ABC transport system ATP-binding protein